MVDLLFMLLWFLVCFFKFLSELNFWILVLFYSSKSFGMFLLKNLLPHIWFVDRICTWLVQSEGVNRMLVLKGFYIYIWIVSWSEQKPGRTSRVKKQLDYLLFRSIIQGNGRPTMYTMSCVIRMCHQGVKVTFIKWLSDQLCCMGHSVGRSRIRASRRCK